MRIPQGRERKTIMVVRRDGMRKVDINRLFLELASGGVWGRVYRRAKVVDVYFSRLQRRKHPLLTKSPICVSKSSA